MATIRLELNAAGSNVSDPGTTKLTNGLFRKVKWKIKDSRIKSFRIEGKNSGGYYPFSSNPNPAFGTELNLEVVKGKSPGEWDYKIFWKDKDQTIKWLDPKIAVKPDFLHLLPAIVGMAALGAISVFALMMLLHKRHKKQSFS